MKSTGQILKESRLRKGITLEHVEKATKIRLKFLHAIENDDYTGMPSPSYAKGFIKNYSDYLGLNTNNVLAFFRRQTKEIAKSQLLPKKQSEYLSGTFMQLTPKRFLILIVLILVALFSLYFGIQYRNLQLPPKLIIQTPVNNSKVTENKIEIIGETAADSTVSINGINVLVREDGKFFDKVNLSEGKNVIHIISTSRYGKTNTQDLVVIQSNTK